MKITNAETDHTFHIVDITQGGLLGKLLRHGSFYLISSVISGLTGVLLLPVNTRLFSPTEFGAIATINSSIQLLGIFAGLSLSAAYMRFYHEYKGNLPDLTRYTSTVYWFTVVWGSVTVLVASLLAGRFVVVDGIYIVPALTLACIAALLRELGILAGSYLRQNHRARLQASISLGNLFSHIAVMLILVGGFGLGLTGKYIGVLCGSGLSALIGTWILYREGLLRFRISLRLLKESLVFSLPLLPTVAGGWISGFSDRVLLSLYGSLAETGVYSVGSTLGRGILVFSEAVFMVYGPMIYAMIKNDPESAKRRIERFIPYFFMLMLWLVLALSLFSNEMVALLTTATYASASSVIPIIVFAYFLGAQYKTFLAILGYERKTFLVSSGAILQAVASFVANLLLIPILGKMAAAWTLVISMGVYLVWTFVGSQRSFYLRIDYRRILTASAIIGLTGIAAAGLPAITDSLIFTIGVKTALLLAATIAMWVSGCILPGDRQRIVSRLVRV